MTGIEYLTADAPFRFFFTGTFKPVRRGGEKRVPTQVRCRETLFAFLRGQGAVLGAHWKGLPWMVRGEFGELTGRYHYHGLLGSGRQSASIADCFKLMHLWRAVGGGHARVRRYNASLPGVAYVLKGEAISEGKGLSRALVARGGTGSGADRYEFAKFGDAQDVYLSPKLHNWIAHKRGVHRSS